MNYTLKSNFEVEVLEVAIELAVGIQDNVTNSTVVDCGTPEAISTWLVAVLSSLYVLTVIVGAFGNGVVIWIVLGRRYMRTVTNYFLLNLAIADFLNVTLNVPFVYVYIVNDNTWIFGAIYCKFQTFIGCCVLSTIVLTFMAMAVERYVAIIHPLKKRLSRRATIAVMLVVWLLSTALAMPAAYVANIVIRDTREVCIAEWPETMQYHHDVLLMVMNYCLPVGVTCFAYTRIALVLWRSRQIGERTREQQESTNNKRKVVKMFVTVVIVFTLCWLPFHSYFVISHTHPDINCLPYSSVIYLLIFWVAMSNSACNPVIYFACNRRFRYNFVHIFRFCPFVTVTKLQESIVRDGISTATAYRHTVYNNSARGDRDRETHMLLTNRKNSSCINNNNNNNNNNYNKIPSSVARVRNVSTASPPNFCIKNSHARAEMTELVNFDDKDHDNDNCKAEALICRNENT